MDCITSKSKPLKGTIIIPPDKSISHRAAMFSSLTGAAVSVSNYSLGADCRSTLKIIQQLGCEISYKDEMNFVIKAPSAFNPPIGNLDCGNSGTTMRLMSGILAGQNFSSHLTGDKSLSSRPMKRVIEPLSLMGAKFIHNNFKAPLTVQGSELTGITYDSPLASAQVKSALLLAGLFADGTTVFNEPFQSRNHTEIMLKYLGADLVLNSDTSTSVKPCSLLPAPLEICGDISSAAFFIVAALIVPGSDILICNCGINKTRSGIIDVIKNMDADFEILNKRTLSGEQVADIRVRYTEKLSPTVISGSDIPRLIDEIPAIAVLLTQADGTSTVKDASDLRNKESDRITSTVTQLRKIGACVNETEDGMIISGKTNLKGDCEIDTFHDHRTAMSFYCAGLISDKPLLIKQFEWVNTSFPEFETLMASLKS